MCRHICVHRFSYVCVFKLPGWKLGFIDPGRRKICNSTLSSRTRGFSFARLSSVLRLCFCRYWVQRYGRDRDGRLAFCGSCVTMCVIVFFYICMSQFTRLPDGQTTADWFLVDLLCQTAELCREQRKGRRQIRGGWLPTGVPRLKGCLLTRLFPSVCIPPLCNAVLWTWSKILLQAKQRNKQTLAPDFDWDWGWWGVGFVVLSCNWCFTRTRLQN